MGQAYGPDEEEEHVSTGEAYQLLAWYCCPMTDYPSLSDLRARGPSLRCTHHEELNGCGSDSEQKDAHPISSKDVHARVIGNSSSMVRICLLALTMHTCCKLPIV